jgi:serine/threonine protein kinase
MPAPARTAKDVFDQALELDSAEDRNAFLDRVCAETPDVRLKVEALLLAYHEAGSQFLKMPEVPSDLTGAYVPSPETSGDFQVEPATHDDHPTARPVEHETGTGEQIGPYRLVEKLGEGGMGAVYRAQQEKPIRRQVALKLIRPGLNNSRILARFDAERQALAMMEHDSIARVFDAGTTTSGQPYFVMELISGQTLNQFCKDHALTVRDRLRLFLAICQAVQHAHQKGIMHRDLKPSNILVATADGKLVPKIIDFGLAKAIEQQLTDHDDQTQAGNILGTWKYMSPEQADVDEKGIDTRTDVYSLGVVLYELLTGTVPIEMGKQKGGYGELQRRIKEEVPPKPSDRLAAAKEALAQAAAERRTNPAALIKEVRGELDWITLKAVEKDPARRYQTARDFAADVERFLNDEPVEACPPSRRYRFGKFVRRNRVLVGTGAAVFAALLLGMVGLSVGLVRANIAMAKERRAKEKEHEALKLTWAGIRALVHERFKPGEEEKGIFESMLEGMKQLALEETDSSKEGREIAAETAYRMGSLSELLDRKGEAELYYRQAIKLYQPMASDFPGEQLYRSELGRCTFDLATLLLGIQRPSEAETAYREAIGLFRKLVAESPAVPAYRSQLGDACNNLGALFRTGKKLKEAEEMFREAVALGEKVRSESPDNRSYLISLAAGYGNLGNVVRDQGNVRESLDLYAQATALLKPIKEGLRTEQEHQAAAQYLRNICWDRAHARTRLGMYEDAVRDWESSLDNNAGAMPQEQYIKLFLEAAKAELKLKQEPKPTPASLFEAAGLNAAAAAAANACGDEEMLFRYYAGRTLDFLKLSKTAGWFADAKAIKDFQANPAFKDVFQLEEFKTFNATLDAGATPTKEPEKNN